MQTLYKMLCTVEKKIKLLKDTIFSDSVYILNKVYQLKLIVLQKFN